MKFIFTYVNELGEVGSNHNNYISRFNTTLLFKTLFKNYTKLFKRFDV